MSAAPQVGGAPQADIWRQVIDLGSRLLQLTRDNTSPASCLIAQHNLIVESAARLIGGQVSLWLTDSLTRLTSLEPVEPTSAFTGLNRSAVAPLVKETLESGDICLQAGGEIIHIPYSYDRSTITSLPEFHAFSIPVWETDSQIPEPCLLGVLHLEKTGNSFFSPADLELAVGLARQSALALQAGLPAAREKWRQDHLDLVHKVSAQIVDIRDLDQLARNLAGLIQRDFGYYYVALFTSEPDGKSLQFRASAGPRHPDSTGTSPILDVAVGQGIIGNVARSGVEILANDVSLDAHYRPSDALPETRSEVAFPIKMGGRILGVLDIQSEHLNFFSELDVLLLRSLASNLAVAIENTRVYNALQRRIDQLSSIYEVTNTLTSLLDEDTLLNQVVELIQKHFGFPYVHIFTVQPGLGRIVFSAGSGSRSHAVEKEGLAYQLEDPQGLIPWVVRHADTRLVNDVSKEPLYRPSPLPPEDTRSEMTIPLIFGGEVLGVLDVQSDRLNAFSEDDRFVFETLADNIAIAMRNAQLFRTEIWRRQVADSMREVIGLLSGDASLQTVLEAILVELQRTLPMEVAAIWLADRPVMYDTASSYVLLRLSAVYGDNLAELQLEIGCTPDELIHLNHLPSGRPSSAHAFHPQPQAWLEKAIHSGQPVIRLAGEPSDPLASLLDLPPDHSAIAAPLRIGESVFGVLTLLHSTPRRYGREAYTIVDTFGNYAAVAIENTRLYEAAHEQAWLSTVLLRVAEVTQEVTELNDLLETVIQITPSLAGVIACLLYLKDDDGNFIPAAASGLEQKKQAEFEHRRFSPGEIPSLDVMLDSKESLLLDSDEANLPLWNLLENTGQNSESGQPLFAVLVPMMSHDEILGAFVVEYQTAPAPTRSMPSEDEEQDERLAIILGIAHQTAVAVENIRLINAQKEAAYVSVALLQVAQAVVSSPDLVAALGTIVRITPILAGVDRAVLFLWDPAQQTFQPVQSYGTAHDNDLLIYKRGEFPLLDAVVETNHLVAYPLLKDKDIFKDAPDEWSFLIPPDINEIEILLDEADRLLLAFPLSVKEAVLGLLLVEEPLPAQAFTFMDRSNRRLRSKRLEILTGVSQQSAMAIQNDILQHEMVERERLEREFQLARQIQRTFLPETLPELPGWDLKVSWQTAREVGGDFYDFFELPNHRLGLVIADVADKGMPAALFMTVVRSLVRASLDIETSPAALLDRVNKLVVPDAAQGMFITLAYVVLDLDSGALEYANAGHNPPLVVRKDRCSIEPIERSGMALGVLEDTRFQGGSTFLNPGDFLVMYTDGITEAFSPDGFIFGEEQLYDTIIEETSCAVPGSHTGAQPLLDAIDRRVSQFIGEASLTDDLTLLVLQRLENPRAEL